MDDKKPMQADGAGSTSTDDGNIASRPGGAGELGGGRLSQSAYWKPQGQGPSGWFLGHGGQSEIACHGGDNPNAKEDQKPTTSWVMRLGRYVTTVIPEKRRDVG
jgi:hypothetical protein